MPTDTEHVARLTNNQDDWMSAALKMEAEIERLTAENNNLREEVALWRRARLPENMRSSA